MSTQPANVKGPARAAYFRGQSEREAYLGRGRRISRLTITSVCREQGDTGFDSVTTPWQSFGAFAINQKSAKTVLALYPPGVPYIKVKAAKSVLDDLKDSASPDQVGALKRSIEKGLTAVEVEFAEACEEDGDRMVAFDTERHLEIIGNHCEHTMRDGKIRGIPLERYVTFRDHAGALYEAVIEDPMVWETLPDDIQAMAREAGYTMELDATNSPVVPQKPVCVYTHLKLRDGTWTVYQEVWSKKVPGSEATYTPDALPYNFIRGISLKDENYGRSYWEDYEGDLQSLDALWQIIIEGSAAVAQLKWLVKPGGVTDKKTFANLPNGGVMTGDPEDVHAAMSEKQSEIAVAVQMAERIEQRLSRAALLYSSIQRSGERVTAQEIQTVRQDLDAGLGGVYSNAAVEWQLPRARLKMARLQATGRVTKLPKGTTKMTLATGDAALGRAVTQQAVDAFLSQAGAIFTPQVVAQYVSVRDYLERSAAANHIDPDGLIKTEDELAEDSQQQQMSALAQNVAPEVVKQGGQMVQNSQQAELAASAAPPTE